MSFFRNMFKSSSASSSSSSSRSSAPAPIIKKEPSETATFIPMPETNQLDLMTALRTNKSSLPRDKNVVRLPNHDIAMSYAHDEKKRYLHF